MGAALLPVRAGSVPRSALRPGATSARYVRNWSTAVQRDRMITAQSGPASASARRCGWSLRWHRGRGRATSCPAIPVKLAHHLAWGPVPTRTRRWCLARAPVPLMHRASCRRDPPSGNRRIVRCVRHPRSASSAVRKVRVGDWQIEEEWLAGRFLALNVIDEGNRPDVNQTFVQPFINLYDQRCLELHGGHGIHL
jgi:hypothetical protein